MFWDGPRTGVAGVCLRPPVGPIDTANTMEYNGNSLGQRFKLVQCLTSCIVIYCIVAGMKTHSVQG